jgi:hypothetical protein
MREERRAARRRGRRGRGGWRQEEGAVGGWWLAGGCRQMPDGGSPAVWRAHGRHDGGPRRNSWLRLSLAQGAPPRRRLFVVVPPAAPFLLLLLLHILPGVVGSIIASALRGASIGARAGVRAVAAQPPRGRNTCDSLARAPAGAVCCNTKVPARGRAAVRSAACSSGRRRDARRHNVCAVAGRWRRDRRGLRGGRV